MDSNVTHGFRESLSARLRGQSAAAGESMQIPERLAVYRDIEAYRQKPLIVYATSTRPNISAMMASDAVRHLIDQLDAIPDEQEVDVLIHSSGGDALAAWKLMSVLRERLQRVSVLVPYMAFSAATLFALGADEIVMHPHASLGPIDPQITVAVKDGAERHFSYEDVGAFIRFLVEEVRISDQAFTGPLIDRLFTAVDPLNVGAAKRASELSTSVGERLLRMHMIDQAGREAAKQIAESLNKSFFAHGDAVSRTRARELSLRVAPDDPVLEALLWKAYVGLEAYMDLQTPFNGLHLFLADPEALRSLDPVAPLPIPPNAPPGLQEHLWQQTANQLLEKALAPAPQVPFSVVLSVVESPRIASECFGRGQITAHRVQGGEVQVSILTTELGWRPVPVT
jgi:hypothetical protein